MLDKFCYQKKCDINVWEQEILLYTAQFTRSLSTEMYFDEKLASSGKHVITISDFNINLLKSETPSYSSSLQDYYLISAIDKPIPVLSFAATLMDNIFTNIPDNLRSAVTLSPI